MGPIGLLAVKFLKLPRPRYHDVKVEKDIRVPMRDGVSLLADRYYSGSREKSPLILVRSFYGRKGMFGLVFGRLIAKQGFQVLIQSCRGTFGSEGEFLPLLNEKDDGIDTVRWIKEQEWYPGEFATTGPSYLGFVQWAIAGEAGADHKAMSVQITASNFRGMGFPGDSFALKTVLSWMYLVNKQNSDIEALLAMATMYFKLRKAYNLLPLNELDKITLGKQVDFWQLLLVMGEPVNKDYTAADFSEKLPAVTAPVNMQGGWCDIFLPWMIADFKALYEAGHNPYIIIGPWTHMNISGGIAGLRDSILWLRAWLLKEKFLLREKPVRLFVMGAKEWMDYNSWPPEEIKYERWHFHEGGLLNINEPVKSEPDRYLYDPAKPTPSLGGPTLFEMKGFRDNRKLEKRDDVLIYDSDHLDKGVELTGPLNAELYVLSSCEHTDFFVRICDVYPRGKSINVCDGLQRVRPGDFEPDGEGIIKVCVEMWPTAYYFRRGHKIRVQVSSGAHPRFAFNTGSGEPLATASKLVTADQKLFHDPAHPSAVILPIMERAAIEIDKNYLPKCIWCNDDDGIFEEIIYQPGINKKEGIIYDKKKLAVHPKHREKAGKFLELKGQYGKWFQMILLLNLFLSLTGLLVMLTMDWFDFKEGYAILIAIGSPLTIFSLFLMTYPFAFSGFMIRSMGIFKALIFIRILATGMFILGIRFILSEYFLV